VKTTTLSVDDVREQLRAKTKETNAASAARALGISPQYMCDVLAGAREPGEKLLAALGLRRVVTYVPFTKPKAERE